MRRVSHLDPSPESPVPEAGPALNPSAGNTNYLGACRSEYIAESNELALGLTSRPGNAELVWTRHRGSKPKLTLRNVVLHLIGIDSNEIGATRPAQIGERVTRSEVQGPFAEWPELL